MKTLKGSYGFYISIGALGLAIAGCAFLYKIEAAKAKNLQKNVTDEKERLLALRNAIPTEEHRQHVQNQKVQIEENFKKIVRQARQWEHVPEEISGLDFQGNMLTTIRVIRTDALRQHIMLGRKARYLGFGEYAAAPPGLDDDVLQLQREFSAAVDIAQLLMASNVYSIDRMVRRQDALMEEGVSSRASRGISEITGATRRIKTKYDFYGIVPFRVQFTCTYPSLAFFQKSLITPNKVVIRGQRLPRNFLVVNDLKFKVKELETESEKLASEFGNTWAVTYTMAGARSPFLPDIPQDLPGADLMWERDPQGAARLFKIWASYSDQEKEVYRIRRKIGENIATEEKERLTARLARLEKELQERELPGRPPQYNLLEVNVLIDFVQFHHKSDRQNKALADELETEGSQETAGAKPSTSSLASARE